MNKAIQSEIFISHRVVNPMLFGVKTEGQLGGRQELVEARRPSDRDKKSKYIYDGDAAIAIVSVRQSPVSLGEEFGTAKKPGKPFIRPALEANQSTILQTLAEELAKKIQRYKSRNSKDSK